MRKAVFVLLLMIVAFVMSVPGAYACSSCGCTVCLLGKEGNKNSDKKWYFRYLYDQVDWKTITPEEANDLLNNDHDVHDRTKDVMHHYQLGRQVTDDLNLMIDVPYVTKQALEFEDVDNLGAGQKAKGMGDMQLLGDYRFWHNDHHGVALAGGVKFPTGDTHNRNIAGERFETDMQPGSGAYNYIVGGIYQFQTGRFSATTNVSRVFTTKGAQGFEYGDTLTASLLGEYLINPNAKSLKTRLGVDTIFQSEWKEKTNGVKNPDSGGQTVLMGPAFRVDANSTLSFTGTFLSPISQNLSGYTQKQDFNWRVGTEVRF